MTRVGTGNGEVAALRRRANVWFQAASTSRIQGRNRQTITSEDHVDDLELAGRVRNDNDSFLQLVDRHEPLVRLQVGRFVDRDADHEGLINEVFFQVFKSIGKYRGESSLASWIRTIATRVGYRYLRKQQIDRSRRKLLEKFWRRQRAAGDPEPTCEITARDRLRDCLGILKADHRAILTLLYWEGCSMREAAERLGWSEAKAKVQAHRARLKLRESIESEHG